MEAMVERRLKRARGWIWDARWGREGRFLGPRVGGGSSLFRGHNYARWTRVSWRLLSRARLCMAESESSRRRLT